MSANWNDAVDEKPVFIFDVQMKDGSVIEARYIMGNFETMDGCALYPEKFRFKEYRVVVPVMAHPDILSTCDECGARISSTRFVCPKCGARRK